MRTTPPGSAVGLVSVFALLSLVSAAVGLGWAGWAVGLTGAGALSTLLARGLRLSDRSTLGPAGRVTLVRAVLACTVAALAADAAGGLAPVPSPPLPGLRVLVALATLALLLDSLDGRIARRTGTVSAFGAQFDMEVDAFLILVLSLHVGHAMGWWVAGVGLGRYVLLAAQRLGPWLRRTLPASRWRKVVAAYQGIALTTATAQVLAPELAKDVLLAGMAALAASFGTEVWSLWRLRRTPAGDRVRSGIGMVIE